MAIKPRIPTDLAQDVQVQNISLSEADMQALMTEMGRRVDQSVKQALLTVQSQSKAYVTAAEGQLETAQQLVSEQVRAKPVTALAAALGAGVLVGLLLNAGRRH
jgi:ElaB/YqjD/DUF883 family membrane-anchored ribosome-binding protein